MEPVYYIILYKLYVSRTHSSALPNFIHLYTRTDVKISFEVTENYMCVFSL